MEPIAIDTRADYDYCRTQGFEPLNDRRFVMEHRLRVSIQRELFGTGHTPEENEKFYRWCWQHSPHVCSECMKPLKEYSAVYISHNLSRGAYPNMAFDPRNVTVLCFECHNRYEHRPTRQNMRIFGITEYTNERLIQEYQNEKV